MPSKSNKLLICDNLQKPMIQASQETQFKNDLKAINFFQK